MDNGVGVGRCEISSEIASSEYQYQSEIYFMMGYGITFQNPHSVAHPECQFFSRRTRRTCCTRTVSLQPRLQTVSPGKADRLPSSRSILHTCPGACDCYVLTCRQELQCLRSIREYVMEVLIPVFVSDYYPMTPETREMTLANDKGNSNSQFTFTSQVVR